MNSAEPRDFSNVVPLRTPKTNRDEGFFRATIGDVNFELFDAAVRERIGKSSLDCTVDELNDVRDFFEEMEREAFGTGEAIQRQIDALDGAE